VETGGSLASLTPAAGVLDARVGLLEPQISELRAGWESSFTNVAAHLQGLTTAVARTESSLSKTEASLSTLHHRLFAVPYMADAVTQNTTRRARVARYGSRNGRGGVHVGFENLFRGGAADQGALAVHSPLLKACRRS
jgi:hypothetical protein